MLSEPLSNLVKQNKVNNFESQYVNLIDMRQKSLLKQVDKMTEFPPTHINSTVSVVMEENNQMRNAINDAALILTQSVDQSKEKNENFILLANKMIKSLKKQNTQSGDVLKSMAIQVDERETEWAKERLDFQKKQRVSKQMIFNLQQDNYDLRKSRILIPRGPSAN